MPISERMKEKFWELVKVCLINFHNIGEGSAEEMVVDFRESFYQASEHLRTVMLHDEAFEIANDLAEGELILADHKGLYDELKRKLLTRS